ncbi:NUDIX domain-containing protein [Actinopolyspora erythraea]|uniref:NUDIX domain-containing protein n=1 Tax=Actinopolyspora erythraea TaxID=414996 RepID=A0A223RXH9_9ACTN|nr:NUDIX domain-containing protein [Actinopolyspora erythraea]ASU80606.1 NUDIX domain-containing protein [Actinopolyspora erythraea]
MVREQHAARLLLFGPDGRILLMRLVEQSSGVGQQLWVTPGGRLEAGESVLDAAGRELFEETGMTDASVGPVVWYGEQFLRRDGRLRFLKERFVLARSGTAAFTDVGWTPEERREIAEMRWWPLDELSTTSHVVKPSKLPVLLRELVSTSGEPSRNQPGVRTIDLQ